MPGLSDAKSETTINQLKLFNPVKFNWKQTMC